MLTDRAVKVHSASNLNGNKTTFNFSLPPNTVAWSYYIGVDQAGQEAFQNATSQLASRAAPIVAKFPGYGPLAALALGSTSYLSQLQRGEDIDYYLVNATGNHDRGFLNGSEFTYLKKGKVINDFSRMSSPLTGSFSFCLLNDNLLTGVTVTVKVTAVAVSEEFDIRSLPRQEIVARQEPYLLP
ncbi:MAG: hypothetical protein HC821_04785 [Lewinella sp.]|nr:hypothetical protein [Lewinella sp.]